MPWVYILRSAAGRHYIGSTVDLERRLAEHQRGKTHSTRRLGGELVVAISVEVPTLAQARSLERELKRKKNPALAIHQLTQLSASVCR